MAGPAHFRCLIYLGVVTLSLAESPPVPAPAPAADTPLEPAVSPKLAKLFGDSMPKFAPGKPGDAISPPAGEAPRNGIIRLPMYLVREPRPIETKDVMTAQAREDAIVKRYVGEPTGLDMALNKYTLNTLWKKIPLIGRVSDFATPGSASMTYAQRITLDYSKVEARRKYIEALGVSADVPPSKPAAKSESEGAQTTTPPTK